MFQGFHGQAVERLVSNEARWSYTGWQDQSVPKVLRSVLKNLAASESHQETDLPVISSKTQDQRRVVDKVLNNRLALLQQTQMLPMQDP